tara:strand:- start:577 stop:759 length:183 start_codon:yes stop_codon:yes gene_type:complete
MATQKQKDEAKKKAAAAKRRAAAAKGRMGKKGSKLDVAGRKNLKKRPNRALGKGQTGQTR